MKLLVLPDATFAVVGVAWLYIHNHFAGQILPFGPAHGAKYP